MVWNASPEIFHLGTFQIRWYGLLFASAFFLGFFILRRIFQIEKKPEQDLDRLGIAMFLGTTLGARLGHCLFYEPEYYLAHPLEILKIWQGGLASHGAAIGILIALYLFSRRTSYATWLWTVDRMVIAIALGASLVRLGNFMNSEIVGKPTDVPWAVTFARVDLVPRHPTQIYESLSYLALFGLLYFTYNRFREKCPDGLLTGIFFVIALSLRFVWEFFKEHQVAFEKTMALNMGQLLSLPGIIFGIVLLIRALPRLKSGQ